MTKEYQENIKPTDEMDLARRELVLGHLKKAAMDSNSPDPIISSKGYDTYVDIKRIARSVGVSQSDIDNISLPLRYQTRRLRQK